MMGGNCGVMPHYNLMMFSLTWWFWWSSTATCSPCRQPLAVWARVLSVLVAVWFCTAYEYDDGQLRAVCVYASVCE